jgi:O-antigen ligase
MIHSGYHTKSVGLPRQSRFWPRIVMAWGAFYFLLFFVGRYPEYQAIVIWGGGPALALLTLLRGLHEKRSFAAPEFVLLGAFLFWCLTGAPLAIHLEPFWNMWRLVFEIVVLVCCVAYSIARSGRFSALNWAMIATGIANGIVALRGGQMARGLDVLQPYAIERVEGVMTNPNQLGFTAMLGILGALALFVEVRSLTVRAILILAATFLGFVLLATASRSAFFCLLVALIVWPMFCFKEQILRRPAGVAMLLLALVGILAGTRSVLEDTYLGKRMRGTEETEKGAGSRSDLAKEAFGVFLDRPLTGVGLGQFVFFSKNRQEAHGDYPELASTTGIIGIALMLAVYALAWQRLNGAKRLSLDASTRFRVNHARVLLLAFLVAGFARPNFEQIDSGFMLAIAIGTGLFALSSGRDAGRANPAAAPVNRSGNRMRIKAAQV